MTFVMFPILLIIAYFADRGYLAAAYGRARVELNQYVAWLNDASRSKCAIVVESKQHIIIHFFVVQRCSGEIIYGQCGLMTRWSTIAKDSELENTTSTFFFQSFGSTNFRICYYLVSYHIWSHAIIYYLRKDHDMVPRTCILSLYIYIYCWLAFEKGGLHEPYQPSQAARNPGQPIIIIIYS